MINYSQFRMQDIHNNEFGNWGIVRYTTFDDTDLCHAIQYVEEKYGDIKEIIFMGNNCENVRIYQIVYRKR